MTQTCWAWGIEHFYPRTVPRWKMWPSLLKIAFSAEGWMEPRLLCVDLTALKVTVPCGFVLWTFQLFQL